MAVRVGVAGVGRVGREHARILTDLPEARLAGVHDAAEPRGRQVASELGVRHARTLEELLAECDAVVVAVPTRDHHSVALAALEADRHVLVEKPLAESLEEADDLIAVAEGRGLLLGVGHVERFNGAVRSARPHLEDPRYLESNRLAPFQPRGTDVTVVLDLMIHDIDLVLGLVESPVASLHAVGTPVLTPSVDIANVRLLFENGAVGEITASRVSEEKVRKLRVFQRSGYLSLDLARETGEFLRRRGEADGSSPGNEGPRDLGEMVERIPLRSDGREPLRLELEAFLQAVGGDDSRLVSAREGRAALELALDITRCINDFADVAVEDT